MPDRNSIAEYYDRIKRRAPAYLDLLTAKTNGEFEAAFTTILEGAIHHLEKNKKNFQALDEEGLSAVLAAALTIPGLIVIQEANSNGHVDLTIEADHCTPARIKLGEAKIFSSPSYHMKGIGQLLGRYTTGRETPGLLINYVRKPDIKAITAKLKTEMDKKLPENQTGPCEDHTLKWSLLTKHKHSSGEAHRIQSARLIGGCITLPQSPLPELLTECAFDKDDRWSIPVHRHGSWNESALIFCT